MSDNIIHTAAVRFRVRGSGNLKLKLLALSEDPAVDNPEEQVLESINLQAATSRLPTVLANFMQQYAQLEFSVDEMDETFTISKITFYTKPIFTSYPG